jgi:hypothetical protein
LIIRTARTTDEFRPRFAGLVFQGLMEDGFGFGEFHKEFI